MIDERARHQLYLSLERQLGEAEASTLMDLLPPVGWADVATKSDLHVVETRIDYLESNINLRFDTSEARIDARFDAVDARFDAVDARFDAVDARFDAMQGQFDAMQGQLGNMERAFATKQDLAEGLHAQTRLMVSLMVGMMLTLTAILVTAVTLVR